MTHNADAIRRAAIDFIGAVSARIEDQLGANPRITQESTWLVEGDDDSYSSKTFTREVPDRLAISKEWQLGLRDGPPEQKTLESLLEEAGVDQQAVQYGYLFPLLSRWEALDEPYPFVEGLVGEAVNEFALAVVDGTASEQSRDVFDTIDIKGDDLVVEPGLELRRATSQDLWEFGDAQRSGRPGPFQDFPPGERSTVLDIRIRTRTADSFETIHTVRDAVHIALRLAAPGQLTYRPWGVQKNFGVNSAGRMIRGGYGPRWLGRFADSRYVVDDAVRNRIPTSWPHIQTIMKSKRHYLRLPAQRLLDAGQRDRADDAVIDYSIGLESLLTFGMDRELGYRFALRGSVLLEEDPNRRRNLYKQLKSFYDLRSKLVHGLIVGDTEITEARTFGERTLRDAWWSFFERDGESIQTTLDEIDERIFS